MTCIVALRVGETIVMGADSAGVSDCFLMIRKDRKIYRVGQMIIGFTDSFRMGQLLGYSLTLPEHHQDVPVERYMATLFIDAVRNCLKTGGFGKKYEEKESGGTFIVAYQGRIFTVYSDYQVAESVFDYVAIGCGSDLALGSLHTSATADYEPEERVRLSLQAAEQFSSGVKGPFHFESLTWKMA